MIGIKHVFFLFFLGALSLQMSHSLVGSSIPRTEWSYRLNPCDNPTWHWKSMETRHILIRLQWWILRNIHRRYIFRYNRFLLSAASLCHNKSSNDLCSHRSLLQRRNAGTPVATGLKAASGIWLRVMIFLESWRHPKATRDTVSDIFNKCFFERWILVVQDLSTIDHPFGMLPMKSGNQPTVVPCYPPKWWSNGNSQSRHVL